MFDYKNPGESERIKVFSMESDHFFKNIQSDRSWIFRKRKKGDLIYFKFKKIIDVLLSILLMICVFPLSLIIAFIHRLFYKGTIFYFQNRLGQDGREFRLIKFRTMVRYAEGNGAQFSGRGDPRITKIGKYMRKCRIDEIPQLLNVLKGEMSFIGPRPERKIFAEKLSGSIPGYSKRLQMKPGLTGLAQVEGDYAGDDLLPHIIKFKYDMFYMENYNMTLDLIILLKTVKTVLQFKGE